MGVFLVIVLAIALMGKGSSNVAAPKQLSKWKGRALVVQTGKELGLPDVWINWLVWVSKGESGWSMLAHNGDDDHEEKEREASDKAYDRLVDQGRFPCPGGASKYAIGSGGWYGQLAPYTVLWGHAYGYGCDPIAIWHDPVASTRMHLRQVRGTLEILRSKTGNAGTFLQLRALYGLPSRDPAEVDTPERRAGYAKTLHSAGIDPSFLDQIVPAFPAGVI